MLAIATSTGGQDQPLLDGGQGRGDERRDRSASATTRMFAAWLTARYRDQAIKTGSRSCVEVEGETDIYNPSLTPPQASLPRGRTESKQESTAGRTYHAHSDPSSAV